MIIMEREKKNSGLHVNKLRAVINRVRVYLHTIKLILWLVVYSERAGLYCSSINNLFFLPRTNPSRLSKPIKAASKTSNAGRRRLHIIYSGGFKENVSCGKRYFQDWEYFDKKNDRNVYEHDIKYNRYVIVKIHDGAIPCQRRSR